MDRDCNESSPSVADAAPQSMAARDALHRQLGVASYNVHRCVGADNRHDPDRIAAVINELGADIVGLQEVDSRYHVEHGTDQIEYLARATGLRAIAGPTLTRHDRSYGNALLTRCEIGAIRRIDLSVGVREKRGALDVALTWNRFAMRVIVTHFGLRPWERVRQTAALLRLLDEHEASFTILLGDFNEWVPMRQTLRHINSRLGRARPVRTFPSRWPTLALDRIWVQPRGALINLWAHRSALARIASDHLPVCATLRLPSPA